MGVDRDGVRRRRGILHNLFLHLMHDTHTHTHTHLMVRAYTGLLGGVIRVQEDVTSSTQRLAEVWAIVTIALETCPVLQWGRKNASEGDCGLTQT